MSVTKATYRVGEFAVLAGVTVRALHHYDRVLEVCLAVPFAASRGRSARDYVRNLADDNAS